MDFAPLIVIGPDRMSYFDKEGSLTLFRDEAGLNAQIDADLARSGRPLIGMSREDEDGWRQITGYDDDRWGQVVGYWVTDQHGEEYYIALADMGDGWAHR